MDAKERALAGALGGVGATLVLSGLREALIAHLAYGVGVGTALGLLRRQRGSAAQEAAVGSALGLLAWRAGWASWLPLTGVHAPPWRQRSPKVLLPVVDHAAYGAAWSLAYRALIRKQG